MARILIVRHGQTAWNEGAGERFRGRADLDLDPTGIQQAAAASARIGQWPVAAIYSSPLRRAMTTARILARPGDLPVQPVEGLMDIDYGAWQGLSPQEAQARDGQLYSLWMQSPHLVTFPQGESLAQVHARAVTSLEALAARHPEETVAIVSHKVVCKVLICHLLGLDISRFWQVEQATCALSVAESRRGALTLTLVNDTCHLKGLEGR